MKGVVVETGERETNSCPAFPPGRKQKTGECMFALLLAAAAFSLAGHVSSHPDLAQTALLWVRGIFPPSPLLSRAICWLFLRSFFFCSSHAPLSQHWKSQWEEVLPDRRRDRGRKTDYLRRGISVGSSEDGGRVSSMNKENVRHFCCALKKFPSCVPA